MKGKQSKALKNWMWDCSSLLRQKAMKVKLLIWCTQPWLEFVVDSSWNVMAHGDAREGKWSGNWRMEWVASTLDTTSEHGVSSITTADAHTSAASSRLNWRPYWFKWTRPFRRKTKSGFCACAVTFQLASTTGGPLLWCRSPSWQARFTASLWIVWKMRAIPLC